MTRNLPVLSPVFVLLACMFAVPAIAQAPSGAERQQELLRIWYEIREGIAESGDVDAKYDVGVANFIARGTQQDKDSAATWFQRAADRGHAGAHYYLGYIYAAGDGREADPVKSQEHYLRAAELGHADAQYLIGIRYANGEGLRRDSAEAAKWMSRAADKGVAGAQYYMGQLREMGQPGEVRPDTAAAVRLYREAANQGHVPAQNRLGELYLGGRGGIRRDLEEAFLWFSLAENQDRVDEISRRMSRGQLAAANDRLEAHLAELSP
ncbi:tetratricopeptide repeat protein [Thioalkalivibrio sp.]|uniref:tetratricopeptide repeat protein n=1 Tax=Thioalkalivibrio sp. TaxID=2093813 RepID=UPI003564C71F